jgi:hypothetical protein
MIHFLFFYFLYRFLTFIFRVPGRPPTFDAFRKKYHDSSRLHSVRFFFKCVDADGSCAWMEVQNLDEPLPVVNDLVVAKVHEQRCPLCQQN